MNQLDSNALAGISSFCSISGAVQLGTALGRGTEAAELRKEIPSRAAQVVARFLGHFGPIIKERSEFKWYRQAMYPLLGAGFDIHNCDAGRLPYHELVEVWGRFWDFLSEIDDSELGDYDDIDEFWGDEMEVDWETDVQD